MTRSHDNAHSEVNECQLGPSVSNDGNRLLGNKRRALDAPFLAPVDESLTRETKRKPSERWLRVVSRDVHSRLLLHLRNFDNQPAKLPYSERAKRTEVIPEIAPGARNDQSKCEFSGREYSRGDVAGVLSAPQFVLQ